MQLPPPIGLRNKDGDEESNLLHERFLRRRIPGDKKGDHSVEEFSSPMNGHTLSVDISSTKHSSSTLLASAGLSDVKYQHAKFLLLNIQSMNPGATGTCRHKYRELESLIADCHSDVPVKFVAVTETWLQEHIRDK